jgi:glycosyltransferase involved in cell wall biosynthesis
MENKQGIAMKELTSKTISVVIPAYNEELNIAGVITGIRDALGGAVQVIVVDDASTDKTGDIARANKAEVIVHPYRKGNGAAIKTGVRQVRGEVVVLIDGDGQHPPEMLPKLLEYMDTYEMVVGARENLFKSSWFRGVGNWMYNKLASYVTNLPIADLTSGFRVVRTGIMKKYLYLLPNGYSYPTTITLAMIKAGYSVKFVPYECRMRKGESKLNPVKDGIRFFVILLKIATLFSPMKVFAPISGVFIALGVALYIIVFTTASRFPKTSLLLIIVGSMIFLMGLVAEQIAMLRMETRD